MPYQKPISFEDRFGADVKQQGFVQVPNVLIRNLPAFGLEPVDLAIVQYIWSRGVNKYTAVSLISEATGKHPNTVRKSLRKMKDLGYLKKIFARGDANKYDLSGLEKCIRVYTKTGITPVHNLYTGTYNKGAKKKQYLGTNIDTNIKKIDELKRRAFPDKKNGV